MFLLYMERHSPVKLPFLLLVEVSTWFASKLHLADEAPTETRTVGKVWQNVVQN